VKLCVNCKWHVKDGGTAYCLNPKHTSNSPVSGLPMAHVKCINERDGFLDFILRNCGPQARYFEEETK